MAEQNESLPEYVAVDPYTEWQRREGVKVIYDFASEDLMQVELGPWERKGGSGAIINIPQEGEWAGVMPMLPDDAHLVEIRPAGRSEPEHHLYEEMVYILSGQGATTLWTNEARKTTFEWHAGSLFAIPLNAWYQHFNASGSEPARYIAVTNAPPMMRLFRSDSFIFDNPSIFEGRYDERGGYFSGEGKLYNRRIWESNFVPNVPGMKLYDWSTRGAGGMNVALELARNSMKCHISEFPVGTYKKAHRHGPGAHLLLVGGDGGYTLLWRDGEPYRKCPWKAGAMVAIPGANCYHQHFNTGSTPARYLALRAGRHGLMAPFGGHSKTADLDMKDGGSQVEYRDEDPAILDMFEEDCLKHGAVPRMRQFFPERKMFAHALPAGV